MYCKNCGSEIPENSSFCPKCGKETGENQVERQNTNGKVTAAKVFIILGSIFGAILLFIPTIIGIIAYKRLGTAKTRDDLVAISVVTLLFCSLIGGIIMLTINDEDLV